MQQKTTRHQKQSRDVTHLLTTLSLAMLLAAAPLVVPVGGKSPWLGYVGWSMILVSLFLPLWGRFRALF